MVASWKYGARDVNTGQLCFNGLRFATREEAERYGWDLMMRWTGADPGEAVESEDAVNYRITENRLECIEVRAAA